MGLPVILAHAGLGIWDEVIFLGVAAIFLVMMGLSWLRSRAAPLEEVSDHAPDTPTPAAEPETAENRFRLD